MSDYISRKAAVKIAQKYGLVNGSALGRHTGLADCIAIEIEGLPAADVEPVRRWIPCSERPPEERGCYLVAVKHWYDGKPVTREAFWNGADWLSCEKRMEITPRVTHWQPLPKPPKEEQNEAD